MTSYGNGTSYGTSYGKPYVASYGSTDDEERPHVTAQGLLYGLSSREVGTSYKLFNRDKRFPLQYENTYLGIACAVAILSFVVLISLMADPHVCLLYQSDTAKQYATACRYIAYITIAFFVGWLVFSLYLLIHYQWTWMGSVFITYRKPVLGEDVEDIEPGILATSSHRSFLDATEQNQNTVLEVQKALRDLNEENQ